MRSPALQPVLALAVLAAGPLLGRGGQVQAGFLVPKPWVAVGLGPDRFAASDAAGWDEADLAFGPGESSGEGGRPLSSTDPRRWQVGRETRDNSHLYAGLGNSGSGASGPSSSSGSGSTVLPASLSPPPAPQTTVIQLLFLSEEVYRPAAFASRLFRPPRVSLPRSRRGAFRDRSGALTGVVVDL